MPGLDEFMPMQTPTALRPLLGLTVLLVEDSRFTSEAVRMLCTRSGARIRRADGLETARKHLAVYHPSVVIVDVGLPDGTGIELIDTLTDATPRIEVILGTSGDTGLEGRVLEAGADGFIPKPIASLSAFQQAILHHLPVERQPTGMRLLTDEMVEPDRIAFQDDLVHIADVLSTENPEKSVDYVTQFLGGVARSASDHDLDLAVKQLISLRRSGRPLKPGIVSLCAIVQDRLAQAGPI